MTALPPARPISTYRLQLHAGFGFDAAAAIVPYLRDLGVSHVYASPFLKARPGSMHGYDITDHRQLNPELGGPDGFDRFSNALSAAGLGLILDFVPNHMGIGLHDNGWWLDVLEWGQASAHAAFFDIDWQAPKPQLAGRVLLPVLGDAYGSVLMAGDLVLRFDAESGSLSAWYFEHRFPIRPQDYARVLRPAVDGLQGDDQADLATLVGAFDELNGAFREKAFNPEARERGVLLKGDLASLCRARPAVAAAIEATIARFAGTPGQRNSFRRLHLLFQRQNWRVAHWRVAGDEINYRRFFDVNDLAGIRIEEPALFEAAHELVGRLIAEGRLHGLRIDHVDGLYDPADYCRKLAAFAALRRPHAGPDAAPFYVVLEKILEPGEGLRDWAVAGTTGYDVLTVLTRLFLQPAGERPLNRLWQRIVPEAIPFTEEVYRCKKLVMETSLAAELNVLANALDRITEASWYARDFTRERLKRAIAEVAACFPVYRTYVTEAGGADADDRHEIDLAIAEARRRWTGVEGGLLDFLRSVFTLDVLKSRKGLNRGRVARFVQKFQQFTGPVMAKAVEDTAFYRYHRLVALNEVGGDPREFGITLDSFHAGNAARARHWPGAMIETATHDTKRGEDVRMRLAVLSELPEIWAGRVQRWRELNAGAAMTADGTRAPSHADEYLLYQTILGTWPLEIERPEQATEAALKPYRERVQAYLLKAAREAKQDTSWADTRAGYETGLNAFAGKLLDGRRRNPFVENLLRFQPRIAFHGMLNALGQTALKLTLPGMPDTYQGAELWDLSMVDPDNRRPVDYDFRAKLLARLETDTVDAMRADWKCGIPKLLVVRRLLALRQAAPGFFADSAYIPLTVTGPAASHVIAFERRQGERRMIVVAARWLATLIGVEADPRWPVAEDWAGTTLAIDPAGGSMVDAIGGRTVALNDTLVVGDLLAPFPVAVLVDAAFAERTEAA